MQATYLFIGIIAVVLIWHAIQDLLTKKLDGYGAWRERWRVPVVKERMAHYLLASAAGDRARKAAFAAAMRQRVVLEVEHGR